MRLTGLPILRYVLTGEHRPYDQQVGYMLAASYRDPLDDALISGGNLAKSHVGMNWWASRPWKIGVGYGLAPGPPRRVEARVLLGQGTIR